MEKVLVITGTSSGVGLALANYFQSKGYRVFGLSRSIPEKAKFETISTDITNRKEIKEAINTILEKVNTIDYVINNAGRGMVGAVEDATESEILDLFNLNVVSSVSIISEILPLMRDKNRGQGKIINISSIGSIMGLPFRGFYSASKAALDKVTEAIRYEVKNTRIQICTINLGDIRTNIADNRIKSKVSQPYKKIFDAVYQEINEGVSKGLPPEQLAPFVEKILESRANLKPHYYYGTITQKLSLALKALLPQKQFEKIIAKYSGI